MATILPDSDAQAGETKSSVDHNSIPEEEMEKLKASGFFETPVTFRSAVPLHAVPDTKPKDPSKFEFAEHSYLGDTIRLQLADGTTRVAINYPLTLYDGLRLTYGQINALGGDFYGTYDPICQGNGLQDQLNRFQRAYNTLGTRTSRQPAEVQSILGILQNEVNQVNAAIRNGQDPSVVYHNLPDATVSLQAATILRPSDQPSYLILASRNFDHFGADARTAYNAGHTVALRMAATGNLDIAYAINAFADHFLEDSFSAGHLRTPRRMLSGDTFKDLCSKFMHDEDNAIGLTVSNPRGNTWKVYGDKRLADNVDKVNLQYCREAVQASADEIYACWRSRTVPAVSTYRVWNIAPTLASAAARQDCCPLFVSSGGEQRRADINDRRTWAFTTNFWYWSTLAALQTSGRWNYPITL